MIKNIEKFSFNVKAYIQLLEIWFIEKLIYLKIGILNQLYFRGSIYFEEFVTVKELYLQELDKVINLVEKIKGDINNYE
tara:strand:+ start:157 stop:393 length:237 start_codon:yes stop_codon:yes gene_type:complete